MEDVKKQNENQRSVPQLGKRLIVEHQKLGDGTPFSLSRSPPSELETWKIELENEKNKELIIQKQPQEFEKWTNEIQMDVHESVIKTQRKIEKWEYEIEEQKRKQFSVGTAPTLEISSQEQTDDTLMEEQDSFEQIMDKEMAQVSQASKDLQKELSNFWETHNQQKSERNNFSAAVFTSPNLKGSTPFKQIRKSRRSSSLLERLKQKNSRLDLSFESEQESDEYFSCGEDDD